MSANSPARKIARTHRLVEELGHDDIVEALKHAEEMRRTLRVIHTWAAFPPLDSVQVKKLIKDTLRIEK